jgi:hypothetical protein
VNWQRGLLRTWIILSVLWLIPVTVFSFDSILRPWIPARAFAYVVGELKPSPPDILLHQGAKEGENLYSFGHYTEPYRIMKDGKDKKELQEIEFKELPDVTMFHRSSADTEVLNRRSAEVHKFASEWRSHQIGEKRWGAIQSAVAVVVIPPLAILALGVGLGWALRGFRKT